MCIIIHKREGKTLSDKLLANCFESNDDGVGFAYVDHDKNELVVHKGLFKREEAVKSIIDMGDREMLIHFRKVSRGSKALDNCHPFLINAWKLPNGHASGYSHQYQFAIAHNGTFEIKIDYPKSDTRTFVEQVLAPWLEEDPELFHQHFKRFVLEGYCGTRNRLVVFRWDRLHRQLNVYKINEKVGNCHEALGCWFSNYSYLPRLQDNDYASHAGFGNHYCGRGINGTSSTPQVVDEVNPDHFGWIYMSNRGLFYNLHTKRWRTKSQIIYRSPYQRDYEYSGKQFSRAPMYNQFPLTDLATCPSMGEGFELRGQDTLRLTAGDKAELEKDTNPIVVGSSSTNGSNISVPRDQGILDDEVDEDQKLVDRVAMQRRLSSIDFRHLSKKRRKHFLQLAKDFAMSSFGDAAKDLGVTDMVYILRSEYLGNFPECSTMSVPDLDKKILSDSGFFDQVSASTQSDADKAAQNTVDGAYSPTED